ETHGSAESGGHACRYYRPHRRRSDWHPLEDSWWCGEFVCGENSDSHITSSASHRRLVHLNISCAPPEEKVHLVEVGEETHTMSDPSLRGICGIQEIAGDMLRSRAENDVRGDDLFMLDAFRHYSFCLSESGMRPYGRP
ncbi:hypothetical protein AVEN_172011-1, partial [Araneus ventricosus]